MFPGVLSLCFEQFLSASAARGLSEKNLKTYRQHLHCISKHLNIALPLSQLFKIYLETMITPMRSPGLANNFISSYVRAFKSFLPWCQKEGYFSLSMPTFNQKDTVKKTYSDTELEIFLKSQLQLAVSVNTEIG